MEVSEDQGDFGGDYIEITRTYRIYPKRENYSYDPNAERDLTEEELAALTIEDVLTVEQEMLDSGDLDLDLLQVEDTKMEIVKSE